MKFWTLRITIALIKLLNLMTVRSVEIFLLRQIARDFGSGIQRTYMPSSILIYRFNHVAIFF